MSQTVEEFISRNGAEPVFEALHGFAQGDTEFHEFAEKNDIDEDSWFEFGWMINEYLGGIRHDVIPLVDFNYRAVERSANTVVEESAPIEWADLVDRVTEEVESASMTEVNGWLEFATVEEDAERRVVDISFENS